MTTDYKLYIGGTWTDAASGTSESITNPATDEVVGSVQVGNASDAIRALQAAELAQKSWKQLPARQRAVLMRAFAGEIRAHKQAAGGIAGARARKTAFLGTGRSRCNRQLHRVCLRMGTPYGR